MQSEFCRCRFSDLLAEPTHDYSFAQMFSDVFVFRALLVFLILATGCKSKNSRNEITASISSPENSPKHSPNKQTFLEFAMDHYGDSARGRKLFFDETKTACVRCHTANGMGGKAGPDLSTIADKFSRRELIQSILEPSLIIEVGYATTILHSTSGDDFEGIIKQATDSRIELIGSDGKPARIATRDIAQRRTSNVSLMPEGLQNALSPAEFADLIAYLESLHQSPENLANPRAMPDVIPQAARPVIFKSFFDSHIHFQEPVWFGEAPGLTNWFVVLERQGKAWLMQRAPDGDKQDLLLDLNGELKIGGGCGLLGMAFHPKFFENRKYFLNYQIETNGQIFTLLVERQFSPDFKRDSGGARVLLEIPAVTQDHTGGNIAFGPDGFLYLGMGDTGPQGDPQGHAQNMALLLGKILRLEVDHAEKGRAYKIPQTNPFRTRQGARPEIWASGFREPWRFSFDRANGDLWIGDVGQDKVEEIDLARAGENFGWNIFEGGTPFSDEYRHAKENYVPPIFAYSRKQGVSVTGGYVYRGKSAPDFFGKYICGDFQSRRVWAITQTNRVLTSVTEIGIAPSQIVSFAEDHAGELYVIGYGSGVIYRIEFPSEKYSAQHKSASVSY